MEGGNAYLEYAAVCVDWLKRRSKVLAMLLLMTPLCVGAQDFDANDIPERGARHVEVQKRKRKKGNGFLARVFHRKKEPEATEKKKVVVNSDKVVKAKPAPKVQYHAEAVQGLLDIIEYKERYHDLEMRGLEAQNAELIAKFEEELKKAGLSKLYSLAIKEKEKQLIKSRHHRDSIMQAELSALRVAEVERNVEQREKENEQLSSALAAGGIALLLTLAISYYFYVSFRRKKRDNQIIAMQKKRVEDQKRTIEEKNQLREESIRSAMRLQQAILPSMEEVHQELGEAFVLFKPKDHVAGDFYWVETEGDSVWYAVADCTGHGVPGAMLSITCSNALNRAFHEFGLRDPGALLDKVRQLVIQSYSSREEITDGMDVALLCFNKKTRELQYAGANNPAWVIPADRKGAVFSQEVVKELRPDKQPVGLFRGHTPFVTKSITLSPGDVVYASTDGFPDQFGGTKGKKLKSKPFKDLLASLDGESMAEQGRIMDEFFESWKGDLDQVDDVCVVGMKV